MWESGKQDAEIEKLLSRYRPAEPRSDLWAQISTFPHSQISKSEKTWPWADAIAVAREPWPAKLDSAQTLTHRYGVDPARGPAAPSKTMLYKALGVTDYLGVKDLTMTLPMSGMNLAFRRTAIVTIAVERFRRAHAGQPPPSLNALVPEFLASVPQDPFDGTPLKYRVAPASYVVYSVDVNRVDDNGVLHGFGSGVGGRSRGFRDDPSPRDIGIRVPLRPGSPD